MMEPRLALATIAAAVLIAGGCGSGDHAPGSVASQESLQIRSLDEHCGDQTAAAILTSIASPYDTTLRPLHKPALPKETMLTIQLAYRGGALTCYPAIVAPPGSTRPDILEQIGIVVDMQFVTADGGFQERFDTEIKGRQGYVSFSYGTAPDNLRGTYRPDLPGYQDVQVGFVGNFGGSVTNGAVVQSGVPPGRVSELSFVAQWATWFDHTGAGAHRVRG